MKTVYNIMPMILCALLSITMEGCAITPTTIVQKPTTAKPVATRQDLRTEGAIFNVAGYRPMFEDRRPRYVGDIVTVRITENTTANKTNGNEQTKDGSHSSAVTSVFGHVAAKANFGGNSSTSFEDSATANASNTFSGSITATVTDVLPNGFLVISGEKQIGLDKGTEFVRFSGVVNPDTINIGNEVPSTKVADARIEYRTNSKIDAAEALSMFSRFFLSMIPF